MMKIHLSEMFVGRTFRPSPLYLFALFLVVFWSSAADACSRLLWNDNGSEVVVGRTMDWSSPLHDMLYIVPRGHQVTGGAYDNPMTWKVKYGSVISAIPTWLMKRGSFTFDDGAVDGLNEKGLSAHALFLAGSSYEKRDPSRPAVSTLRWVHYLLDNFATVEDALAGMDKVQIVPGQIANHQMDFHLTVEDKSGDSAIIEFIDGQQTVHHGRQFSVMTNSPPYDAQIENLAQYRAFGGQKELPGDITSNDRFVRLQYFSQYLPHAEGKHKAVSYILSAMHTVTTPFGAPYPNGAVYPTHWISVSDLKNGVYHYNWLESPDIIRVELAAIDFSKGSGVRWLNPRRPGLSGTVNDQFQPIDQLRK